MVIKELNKPEGTEISEAHAELLVLFAAALGCRIENQTDRKINMPSVYNILPPAHTIGICNHKFYKL